MKKLVFLLLISPLLLMARGPEKKSSDKKEQEALPNLAANCTPATTIIFLEFNNVRTRVEAGGLWWQDRPNGRADYEVPIGSNKFAIFAGGLWLGGTDVNGQLKIAASLFGAGVDYWAGPLDTTGTAEITPETCIEWDRFFEISRAEVAQFRAFQLAKEEGTAAEDFPGYQIPTSILEWPGNGNTSIGQDFRLAPYINVAGDITYEPELGDFPFYDLNGDVDCRAPRATRSESSTRPLFGDQTFWWIFNDKGNSHSETNAPSIGMEIHGQAFAFATNDAVNDMTFYNFELINRSTFTLTDTYFASYVDPDLGNSADDYVGCDVERGLGYCFNGDGFDESVRGQTGYGSTPAAIGIDFFEGPFQDADGLPNPVGIGPNEALNGLGYDDTIPDNERFGMRRFVFYNLGTGNNGDPELAIHFYNYMRGIWKNGQVMRHGGDGFQSSAVEDIPTAFMFPGESDPLHWGTTDEFGITEVPNNTNWTEDNPGGTEDRNDEGDRRFLQSAGPFTLRPGNVNDITVGVVFGQAESGGRLASVETLIAADDKAQSLFDNCFQVLNGPDAPQLDIQELDQELVMYLSNSEISNNQEEIGKPYIEEDVNIVTPDELLDRGISYDSAYRFQGYQVFQLAGPGISVGDLEDPSKARLVFQADVKDDVVDLINFTFDEELGANIPVKKVTAANDGIKRSFRVNQDLFASGNPELINFKTYYYIAIAYAHNEFKPYAQDTPPDSANPFAPASDGQTQPYISSRRGSDGGDIKVITAIPHNPLFEEGGTVVRSEYGDEIQITRLQGRGNGGNPIRLTTETMDRLLEEKVWEDPTASVGELDYEVGSGPFTVKVADPLNLVDGTFFMQFLDESTNSNGDPIVTNDSEWKIWLDGSQDTVFSSRSIEIENEQLLFSPNWGLSISVKNGRRPGNPNRDNNGFISSSIIFDDPTNPWLSGIQDSDLETPANWILSGTFDQAQNGPYNDLQEGANFVDPNEAFESMINATVAPYRLTRFLSADNQGPINTVGISRSSVEFSTLNKLNSMTLIITSDKSKWTRCPVVETGNVPDRGKMKQSLSVDKDGNPVDTTGFGNLALNVIDTLLQSNNEEDAGFGGAIGMGWFPGYVFNKETGERWNIAFGEDTKFSFNNGDDMIWNPTSVNFEGLDPALFNRIWGGKHFVYFFRNFSVLDEQTNLANPPQFRIEQFDQGAKLKELLGSSSGAVRDFAYNHCSYAMVPMLAQGEELMSSDVRIDINVTAPFGVQDSELSAELENQGRPVYRFRTQGVSVSKQQTPVLADELKEINVVPNPYRAISEYEETQIDNIVKFTNLPEQATIRIYNTNGTLIRTFQKASPLTFLDWDLKNQVGIPIASGVYLIHVEVPGVGEKVLKWFGVLRPVDLNNF